MHDKYVGRKVLIHAGISLQRTREYGCTRYLCALDARQGNPAHYGGIIGVAIFGYSFRTATSPWAESGLWHWPILHAKPLPFFPCTGNLRFFNVDYPYSSHLDTA